VGPCTEALEEALVLFGEPENLNTEQGSQSTSLSFTQKLVGAGFRISMDARGCWMANVFFGWLS
jgi:putative transposase